MMNQNILAVISNIYKYHMASVSSRAPPGEPSVGAPMY